MNITPTAGNAPKSGRTIKVQIPEVNIDSVVDGGWDVIDKVGDAVVKTPGALIVGAWSAIPGVGLQPSLHLRDRLEQHPEDANSFNKITNFTSAAANVSGMGVGALGLLSAATGVGPAKGILLASAGLFGLAGVAGAATMYAVA